MEKLPVTRAIELKGITFHYPHSEALILENAELTIPVGRSVGIVGTTGAGKTTIVDILLGLLAPQAGEILADGMDVRKNYQGFLKNVGYIPQTIFMIDTTIRKNVAFGVPDDEIDDARVWAALAEAQLDDFVRSLPEGLDTTIGERGIRLSGGQRQRISIARALAMEPDILILDDSSSALDYATDAALRRALCRLPASTTVFIVSQRTSSLRHADNILVLEDGRLAGQGRHEELMAACPVYREIHESQFRKGDEVHAQEEAFA